MTPRCVAAYRVDGERGSIARAVTYRSEAISLQDRPPSLDA